MLRQATKLLLVSLLLVAAIVGWYQYFNIREDYLAATDRLDAYARIRDASANFTAARFVRALTLTDFVFGTPVQVTRNDQTYVDYQDSIGTMATDDIVRAENPSQQPILLTDIPAGTEIRLDMHQTGDTPPRFLVDGLYIID